VYFGQTDKTGLTSLETQCADPSIDIVILSFITKNNYKNSGYPELNFGAACGGQTDAMVSQGPGLLRCYQLETMIQNCQTTYGKKVMVSIGGATHGVSFTSDQDATNFGNSIWKIFGPKDSSISSDLRPFGEAVIDGFDLG
jgi:chitinase